MANEFIVRKGLISLQDSQFTGSINISQNLTVGGTIDASFNSSTGTAISGAFDNVSSSLASDITLNASSISSLNAASSSYLLNTTDTFNGNLTIGGNLIVNATPSKVTPDGNDFVVGGQLEAQGTAGSYIYSLALGSYSPTNTSGNLLVPGRIGVGTDSPGSKLDINGDINLLNSGNALRFNGNGAVYYSSTLDAVAVQQTQGTDWTRLHVGDITTGNAKLRLQTGTSSTAEEFGTGGWTDLLTVDTNGNLGIGTTSPDQKLRVEGKIYSVDSGTDGGQIRLANSGGGSNWYWAARTTGFNLGELGAADGRIFIANGGCVGIGTISPTAKLHVNGGQILNGDLTIPYSTAAVTNTIGVQTSPTNPFSTTAKTLVIQGANAYQAGTPTQAQAGGDLYLKGGYGVTNTGLGVYAGDVYIQGGTTYTGGTDGAGTIYLDTAGTTRMFINTYGNVGIGTTSPTEKLAVDGNLKVFKGDDARIYINDVGDSSTILLRSDGSNTSIGTDSNHDLQIHTNGSERMRISSGGIVYIMGATASVNNSLQFQYNSTAGSAEIYSKSTAGNTHFEFYASDSGTTNEVVRFTKEGRITSATDNKALTAIHPRSIAISHGGSNSWTYDLDPVALFGTRVSGGHLHIRASGWQSRLNAGYIVYRNDGGGSSVIGTGNVTYFQTVHSDNGGTDAAIAVSLPSSSTNVIRISFSGWHSNNHGFECVVTTTN